jgi:protein-S-isoprenylcysteine O-methyltransferase Ste14
MRTLATALVLAFFLVAFGLRSLVQWRRTGRSGFVGLREGAGRTERAAGALLAAVMLVAPVAPWIGRLLWPSGHALGAAIAILGIAVTLVAQLQMGDSWRIGVDSSEHTELVTTRLFSQVRNPIFSAMLLCSIGLALAAPTALALALPLLLLLAVEVQVRQVEEPYLLRTHGEAYRAWAARTGRFLPGLGCFVRGSK